MLHRSIRLLAMSAAVLALLVPWGAHAQIVQGNGEGAADNRTSSMGAKTPSSSLAVHESQTPQAVDATEGARRATAGRHPASDVGTSFKNGLYGTGTGNNNR